MVKRGYDSAGTANDTPLVRVVRRAGGSVILARLRMNAIMSNWIRSIALVEITGDGARGLKESLVT